MFSFSCRVHANQISWRMESVTVRTSLVVGKKNTTNWWTEQRAEGWSTPTGRQAACEHRERVVSSPILQGLQVVLYDPRFSDCGEGGHG